MADETAKEGQEQQPDKEAKNEKMKVETVEIAKDAKYDDDADKIKEGKNDMIDIDVDDDGDDVDDMSHNKRGTERRASDTNNNNDEASKKNTALGSELPSGRGSRRRPPQPADRSKICPFLIRLFIKQGSHHAPSDFKFNKLPSEGEVHVHAWKDATLREVLILASQSNPLLNHPDARITVQSVYPDPSPTSNTSNSITTHPRSRQPQQRPPAPPSYLMRDLASVSNRRRLPDEDRTLDDLRFQAGDFLDVSIVIIGLENKRDSTAGTASAAGTSATGGGSVGGLVGSAGRRMFGAQLAGLGSDRHNPYARPGSGGGSSSGGGGGGFSIRGRGASGIVGASSSGPIGGASSYSGPIGGFLASRLGGASAWNSDRRGSGERKRFKVDEELVSAGGFRSDQI